MIASSCQFSFATWPSISVITQAATAVAPIVYIIAL